MAEPIEPRPGISALARHPELATTEKILAALCRPISLSYVACELHVSLSTVRGVRDKHRSVIVNARLKAGQHIDGVCYHLDLLTHLDSMREWHKRVMALQQAQEQEQAHAQD